MSKALVVIDMQNYVVDRIAQGIEFYPEDSIEKMRSILEKFRASGCPVLHVRHQTTAEGSSLHKDSALFLPVASFEELASEPVFIKTTSSAFSSTQLLSHLQSAEISEVVVIGAVAGFCVNSTVRMGADLGLKMIVIQDAVVSFALEKYQGRAEAIHNVTLALLDAGFALVISCSELSID